MHADSNISCINNNSSYNVNKKDLLENQNNILENLSALEKKKYSYDFLLTKDSSFKQNSNETPIYLTPRIPENHNLQNNIITNDKNSALTFTSINNINNNPINAIASNNQNIQNFNNDLNKIISEENLIQENEEKINISSHRIENINIKSFDTGRHMYRKSELTLDPLELEKIQQLYNFNLNTEENITNSKNLKSFSPKEKINKNLNLNFEKNLKGDFYNKFLNSTNNVNQNVNIDSNKKINEYTFNKNENYSYPLKHRNESNKNNF